MKKVRAYIMFLACFASCLTQVVAQSVVPQLGDKITTSEGIYIVSGNNLIPNHSFDEGFTGWLAANGSAPTEDNFALEATGGADGGPYLRALGSAGSTSGSSILTSWPVTVGKTYVFSVWANRPSTDGNMQWSLIFNSETQAGRDTQVGTVNFEANKWVQTEIVFTAEHPLLIANFAWLSKSSFDAFFLGEVTLSDELATAALEATIADGKYQLENTVEGNERGQYTTEVRATLQTAISVAEDVLTTATKQEQINSANATLKAAIATYQLNVNGPFKVGVKYNIVHNSGNVMTTTGGTVKVVSEDVDDKGQVFSFVPAPDGAAASGYNLQADDGTFVYLQGSWDTKADGSFDTKKAEAIFQIVDKNTYIQLKNMKSNKYLGTNSNSSGSEVYSDKSGSDSKHRWTLKEFIPKDQRDDEYVFNQLLEKAQIALSEVETTSIGTELFMTSREAYNTFAAAVATAEGTTSGYKTATETLQAALDAFAANKQIQPDPGKKYVITQRAGSNRLAYTEGQTLATVRTPSDDPMQQFTFGQVTATSNFTLKNVGTSKLLAKSANSTWDTSWADDGTNALAQWIITRRSDGTYTLQNASGKGYLGSDATADASPLYCDKGADATNSRWFIEEFSITAKLQRTIEQAKELAANTPVGSAYYEVPQSAMDTFLAAIATAEAALSTVATFEEGSVEADILSAAMTTFKQAFNPIPPFDEGVTYTITHYGGALLTATESGNATITTLAEEGATETQLVTFEPVEGKDLTYYIKSIALETYLARNEINDWDTQWQTENGATAQIEVVHLDGQWLGLRFVSNGKYVGTDGITNEQMVYGDKAGAGNNLCYWLIDSYVTVTLDRVAFNEALTTANTLLSEMTPGYLTGQYFEEDITAFRQVVNTARSAASKAKDQETLDAVTLQFKTDIETARAKVHTKDYMNHTELTAAINTATNTLASAVAGDCNGQYPTAAITAYNQVLTTAKAVNDKDDEQLTQAEIDAATANLKDAAKTFNAARIIINLTALKAAISEAQQAMSNAQSERGDGPGKFPENAFTALQTKVNHAQNIVNENNVNQATVDAETSTVTTAIATFKASRIGNDYSDLQNLVDEATQLIADAVAGKIPFLQEDLDELKASVEKNAAALESTNQDVIDRAAKLLRRDISLFKGLSDGINGLTADHADIRIYDLNGRPVTTARRHLSHGTYVMQIKIGERTVLRKFNVK
ncbi:MAG: RICIN domain-containing protein [Bacteroidaceae bacterium]|nr:RICIN domain-containing protein [Bacteroidaceae bacterium]